MLFKYINRPRGGSLRAFDSDVLAWESAVVENGGSVSLAQRILTDQLVHSLKTAGTWALMDDALLLVAETSVQALTSLKQRRLATAVNSPVFTVNQGYTFDGLTNYIDTGFVPSSHFVNATATNCRIAVYERSNPAAHNNTIAVGVSGYNLCTRNSTPNLMRGSLCSNTFNVNGSEATDRRGLNAMSRSSSTNGKAYRRGGQSGTESTSVSGTTTPSSSVFIGGNNNAGFVSAFSGSIGAVMFGASLSDAQEIASWNAWQEYMTVKGANV